MSISNRRIECFEDEIIIEQNISENEIELGSNVWDCALGKLKKNKKSISKIF
jgi:hypothetical protein